MVDNRLRGQVAAIGKLHAGTQRQDERRVSGADVLPRRAMARARRSGSQCMTRPQSATGPAVTVIAAPRITNHAAEPASVSIATSAISRRVELVPMSRTATRIGEMLEVYAFTSERRTMSEPSSAGVALVTGANRGIGRRAEADAACHLNGPDAGRQQPVVAVRSAVRRGIGTPGAGHELRGAYMITATMDSPMAIS